MIQYPDYLKNRRLIIDSAQYKKVETKANSIRSGGLFKIANAKENDAQPYPQTFNSDQQRYKIIGGYGHNSEILLDILH